MGDEPKGGDWIKYWFYRAIGQSDTQARWRLRERPKEAPVARIYRHRHCGQCSQLLLIEERVCHQCGARQLSPSWLLRLSRSLSITPEAVIPVLASLCLAGYLLQIYFGGSLFGGLGTSAEVQRELLVMGAALNVIPLEHYLGAQSWRLFTYTCMHGNLMHIGFNLVALLQIGPLVARTFGFSRTLFIWVFSGATAILLPLLVTSIGTTIGASGSVFGLIGCAMAFGHRVGTPQGLFIRNKMIEWTIFCTLFGMMMGGVAHSAHFGGLIGGALLSWVFPPPRSEREHLFSPLLLLSSIGFILWSGWAAWRFYDALPASLSQLF